MVNTLQQLSGGGLIRQIVHPCIQCRAQSADGRPLCERDMYGGAIVCRFMQQKSSFVDGRPRVCLIDFHA